MFSVMMCKTVQNNINYCHVTVYCDAVMNVLGAYVMFAMCQIACIFYSDIEYTPSYTNVCLYTINYFIICLVFYNCILRDTAYVLMSQEEEVRRELDKNIYL